MEIGQVCGTMIGDDGVMRYRIFNGYHHEKPVYFYRPVPSTEKPVKIYDHELGEAVSRERY